MWFIHNIGNKMIKLFQILPGDVKYFNLLLIKSYSNRHNFYLSVQWNPQISVFQQGFYSFEIGCK